MGLTRWKLLPLIAACAVVAILSSGHPGLAQNFFGLEDSQPPDTQVLPQSGNNTASPFRVPDIGSIYDSNAPAFSMPELSPGIKQPDTAPASFLQPKETVLNTNKESPANESLTQPSAVSTQSAQANVPQGEKTAPWYRYMTLGPDLSRELQESQHCLLPIMPMPIRQSDQSQHRDHNILIRATNNERYASFRTPYGFLYAKSSAIALVSTSGKILRICNLNAREGQILFKLNNGQLLCLGAGSEMIMAPSLENISLNPNDGLARRGITRLPRDGQVQLAFAQFSFDSFFDLPELKYFKSTQPSSVWSGIEKTAAYLNGIRGQAGFRKAITVERQPIAKRQPEMRQNVRTTAGGAGPVTTLTVAAKSQEKSADVASIKPPDVAGPVVSEKDTTQEGKFARLKALGRIASLRKPQTPSRSAPSSPGVAVAIQRQVDTASKAGAIEKADGRDSQPNKTLSTSKMQKEVTPHPVPSAVSAMKSATPRTQTLYVDYGKFQGKSNVAPKMHSSDPSLSAEVKTLLVEAEREEKRVGLLRKQARRNTEFMNSGFLNPLQCQKMVTETNQLNVNAALAEEKALRLRKEAAGLTASKTSSPAL